MSYNNLINSIADLVANHILNWVRPVPIDEGREYLFTNYDDVPQVIIGTHRQEAEIASRLREADATCLRNLQTENVTLRELVDIQQEQLRLQHHELVDLQLDLITARRSLTQFRRRHGRYARRRNWGLEDN
jgi:hypothetical protein